MYFEIEFSRDWHLSGDYELESREDLIMEFEVRGEIRFRIAEELGASSPTVTGWKLE